MRLIGYALLTIDACWFIALAWFPATTPAIVTVGMSTAAVVLCLWPRIPIIPPGAKVVPRLRWWHRLYNATPLFIRRRFWA